MSKIPELLRKQAEEIKDSFQDSAPVKEDVVKQAAIDYLVTQGLSMEIATGLVNKGLK